MSKAKILALLVICLIGSGCSCNNGIDVFKNIKNAKTLEELKKVECDCEDILKNGIFYTYIDNAFYRPSEYLDKQKLSLEYLRDNPNLKEFVKRGIMDKSFSIGMTAYEVRLSIGAPVSINKTVGSWGVHEQWGYGDIHNSTYIYFEDGICTSYSN